MHRIAVFAGRSEIDTPDAFASAHRIGQLLGESRRTVIYDGCLVGPINTLVAAAKGAGSRIVSVMVGDAPALDDQIERRTIGTPAEFGAAVRLLADAFLALPNGFPSLEEALAVWDWSLPRRQEQPLGLLDLGNYYSDLLKQASDGAVDRFVRESQRGQLIVSSDSVDLLRRLAEYRPPETRRSGAVDFE